MSKLQPKLQSKLQPKRQSRLPSELRSNLSINSTNSTNSINSLATTGLNSVLNTVLNTLGLSVVTTVTAISAHHVWRKRHNSDARLSDYLSGTAEQWQRIEQANHRAWQAWSKTYRNNSNNDSNNDSNQTKSNTQTASSAQEDQLETPVLKAVQWVSGVANKTNAHGDFDDFSVVGIDKERSIVWQTDIPERVHDIVVQPIISTSTKTSQRHVAVMGRRPSEYFWIMSCVTGEIVHAIRADDLQQTDSRHFYGHACYSLDGKLLYVAENNTVNFGGIIGVYDVAEGYRKINEFATHGIGPHELIMHPDGNMLIIANGGIKTERASREELNIESMQPSLVYLSLAKGEEGKVLQQVEPKHNQMSVRHISAITQGELKNTIAVSIQFQGEKHLNMPLVLTHTFGDNEFMEYTPTHDWRQFHHYIASVLVNSSSNLICATSPIGGCVSVFDMTTHSMIDTVKIPDCAGIAVANHHGNEGFMVSDGKGELTVLIVVGGKLVMDKVKLPMAFDNHMQSVDIQVVS